MYLIEIAVKSTLLGAIGLGALFLFRSTTAAFRHWLIVLLLGGICLLPFTAKIMPSWQIPIYQTRTQIERLPEGATTSSLLAEQLTPVPPARIDPERVGAELWLSVSIGLTLLIGFRLLRLRILECSLVMAGDPDLQAQVTGHCLKAGERVLLLEGRSNEPPMTWGHLRPVVLLPRSAKNWSDERVLAVVLHELAHIKRGDWLRSVLGELVCAWCWYNPVVWILRKRFQQESELAADEWVLASGMSPAVYASELVSLLKEFKSFPESARPALAMARPGPLRGRIEAILATDSTRHPVNRYLVAATWAVSGVSIMGLSSARPTIVRDSVLTEAKAPSVPFQRTVSIPKKTASSDFSSRPNFPKSRTSRHLVVKVARPNPKPPRPVAGGVSHIEASEFLAPHLNAPISDDSALETDIKDEVPSKKAVEKQDVTAAEFEKPEVLNEKQSIDSTINLDAKLREAEREIERAYKDVDRSLIRAGTKVDIEMKGKRGSISINVDDIEKKALDSVRKAISAAAASHHQSKKTSNLDASSF